MRLLGVSLAKLTIFKVPPHFTSIVIRTKKHHTLINLKIKFCFFQVVNKGTITGLPAKDEYFNGKVVRSLRSVNPDQDEYCGLIQTKSEEGEGE